MVESRRGNGYATDKFLGTPYKKDHNPHVLLDPEIDVLRDGVNCQAFVHLYYESEFGIKLPIGMWSKEIFEDTGEFFRSVTDDERIVRGDVCFFGRQGAQSKDLHLGIVHKVGENLEATIIRHANQEDNEVSDWSLSKALDYPRYSVLRGVRRIIPDIFSTTIAPVLVFESSSV